MMVKLKAKAERRSGFSIIIRQASGMSKHLKPTCLDHHCLKRQQLWNWKFYLTCKLRLISLNTTHVWMAPKCVRQPDLSIPGFVAAMQHTHLAVPNQASDLPFAIQHHRQFFLPQLITTPNFQLLRPKIWGPSLGLSSCLIALFLS